jgi:hypothetical protein
MVLLCLGLSAALGGGTFVMAQTAAPPTALAPEQQLLAKRFAERQAIREAERVARIETRIIYLRERLQITAAQDQRWSVFAQAIRAQQAARSQAALAPAAAPPGPLPLTERLTRRQADLAARSQRLAAVTDALTPLYAMLSAEQKAVADRLIGTSEDGDVVIRRGRNRDR